MTDQPTLQPGHFNVRCAAPSRWAAGIGVLASALASMGHNGGCHPDEGDLLPSPAHVLGVVLETDGVVEAELIVVSTATQQPTFVQGARVFLEREDEATEALTSVAPGTYVSTTSDLRYAADITYRFMLEIDEDVARLHHATAGAFELAVHGSAEVPDAWVSRIGSSAEVGWSPAGQAVLIDVFDADGVRTSKTLDWDNPAISADSWRQFPTGGTHPLGPEAFTGPSPHRVRVCAIEVFRRDDANDVTPQHEVSGQGPMAGLGWLSGGVAGRCVSIAVE